MALSDSHSSEASSAADSESDEDKKVQNQKKKSTGKKDQKSAGLSKAEVDKLVRENEKLKA